MGNVDSKGWMVMSHEDMPGDKLSDTLKKIAADTSNKLTDFERERILDAARFFDSYEVDYLGQSPNEV